MNFSASAPFSDHDAVNLGVPNLVIISFRVMPDFRSSAMGNGGGGPSTLAAATGALSFSGSASVCGWAEACMRDLGFDLGLDSAAGLGVASVVTDTCEVPVTRHNTSRTPRESESLKKKFSVI